MASSLPLLSIGVLVLCALGVVQGGALRVFGLSGRNMGGDFLIPDPYIMVWCGSSYIGRTEVKHTENPTWTKEFNCADVEANLKLKLEVYDFDFLQDDLLGICNAEVRTGTHTITCGLGGWGIITYSYTLTN